MNNSNNSLESNLQKAFDERDCESIGRIMPNLFPDYREEYAETLIRYNAENNIKASDFLKIKINFPYMTCRTLFSNNPDFIKNLCDISEEELAFLNSPCG